MRTLKSLAALILIASIAILFACGDQDDPYNSTRPVDTINNTDYGDHPGPGPAGGGSGTGTSNNSDDNNPSTSTSTKLKDLGPQQTDVLCENINKKYENHDIPHLPEGRGACLDFAVRTAYEFTNNDFDVDTQFMICEDEFIDCLTAPTEPHPDLPHPNKICMNPRAQVTCDATVDEFERCATEDAKTLTNYFLQINNDTCANYILDEGIEALDNLLNKHPYPTECTNLLEKCPNIFD